MSTAPEDDYIEQAVGNYVAGMVFADEALLRRTLHPDSRIMSYHNGQPQWFTLDEFIETIKAEGTADSDFSPYWESQVDEVDFPASPSVSASSEYRKSLKVYADCVNVSRNYVSAYPHA